MAAESAATGLDGLATAPHAEVVEPGAADATGDNMAAAVELMAEGAAQAALACAECEGVDDSVAMVAECSCCNGSFTTLRQLGNHVRAHHADATTEQLAGMGFARCPADGCGKAYHLFNNAKPWLTSFYQHQQVYSTQSRVGQVDAHMRAQQGFGSPAGLLSDAVGRCGELAPPNSPGAAMARNLQVMAAQGGAALPPPTAVAAAETTAGAAAAAAVVANTTTTDNSPTTDTTVPSRTYDYMAFLDFDMDRLKRVSLHNQEAPRDATKQWQAAQPLVFAWQAAAAQLTGLELSAAALATGWADRLLAVASPRGRAALKMYYLAHAAMLLRVRGDPKRSDSDVVEMAKLIASSPTALIEAVERLIAAAEHATAESLVVDDDDGVERTPPPPPTRTAKHKRARFMARKGEYKKAKGALESTVVADGTDSAVRAAFEELTPQDGAELPPELVVSRLNVNCVLLDAPRVMPCGAVEEWAAIAGIVPVIS